MGKVTHLVLLPGMDGTTLLLAPLVAELTKQDSELNCICVSYPTSALMDYKALTDYVRRQIPVGEPYILLGESFSGPIAIMLASTANKMLKGLVLAVTFVRNPKPIFAKSGSMLPNLKLNTGNITRYFMPLISQLLLGGFANKKLNKELKMAIDQVPISTFRYRLQQVLVVDVERALEKIDIPIMYMLAKQDMLVKRNAYEAIAACYQSKVDLVELDGPHMLLQVFPEEVAKHILKFKNNCVL